jgi:amino acid adenylation domain-containing protein
MSIPIGPITPTEDVVARIWKVVFGGIEVGVHDDFFNSGGDSLMAMQLLALVREETGVELALVTVFDERTVAGIARRVDEEAISTSDFGPRPPRLEPIVVSEAGRTLAPSITQARACFMSDLAEEALPYQSNAVLDFVGRIDAGLIEISLQRVVDRHDVLRTTFPVADDSRVPRMHPMLAKFDDQRVQIVHPFFRVALPIVDLRAEPSPDLAFDTLLADCMAERIELSALPLVRWTLALITDDHARLIQVEHYVIHDGRSFANIVAEIVGTYRALLDHHPPAFPAPALQYADFANWQRSFVESDAGRRQFEYWRRVLAELPLPPELATDRPAPLTRSFRGTSVRWDLTKELVSRIHQRAAQAGATTYVVMLAAFVTLLSRLSGEPDVVVGSSFANRQLPGTESLLGMIVNTVVLRTDLSGDPTVEQVLAMVRTASLGAIENQEMPFEEVVRALAPPRRDGHNPICDHLFSFQDSAFSDMHFDDLQVEISDVIGNGSSKADLNVIVINRRVQGAIDDRPDGRELSIVWEYASDVFDAATAESLLASYVTLLEQMTEGGERRISDLELVDDRQREQMIERAITVTSYEDRATMDEVFADRVRETPDAVALDAGTSRLTYRELDLASDRLGHRLGVLGVRRGVVVGVFDDRSPAMVVALLAILKVGGSYVGLDRSLPVARLQRIVADAHVRYACVGSTSTGQFMLDGVDVVGVDTATLLRQDASTMRDREEMMPTARLATDVAYVSFTSGSTGEPKGVEVLHRGVVRLVRTADYLDLGPTQVVLAASPLAFDASTFELWGPLLNGGRVVLAPPGPLSTSEIAEVMAAGRVTTAWFSAGMFHQMVDHEIEALCRLRQVLAGGDVLSRVHVNRLLEVMDIDAVLVNGYGPTEGTTFSCCHVMLRGHRIERSVPLGRPVANTSVVIVDGDGHFVPDGAAGELWIGGDGVARGYLGRPDLTAERFVENPFGGRLGDRLYRTGDRVRRNAVGVIEFLGRIDRQVKIRGFRVEPAEAEAALLAHTLVAQAHVQPVQNRRDDQQLVAYLVRAAPSFADVPGADAGPIVVAPTDEDLAGFLHQSLPRYLVPDFFVWLDQIPLRANGKVDFDRLPPPPSTWFSEDPGATEESREAIVPRSIRGASRLENTLVTIFQEVMGIRDIGLDDAFFDLGGHSLLAVELIAAIERSTGARLPLTAIFEAPTVAKLAELLRSDGWDATIGSLVPLTTTGSRPPLFAVTAGDGNVVGFGPLARRLGPDQPFYVLQPFGLDSSAPLHRSVESMARHYVREVRRIEPHGPYLLCGRCLGSLVVYEMARRIESAGEEVALLVSIDSGGPLWRTRRLANGVEYDQVMHMALLRGTVEGVALGDVFGDRDDADRFTTWLGETVTEHDGTAINRYVYAAYQARADVQRAYPLEDMVRPGHEGLFHWAWVSGPLEMGLQTSFLAPPTPAIRTDLPLRRPGKPTRRASLIDRSVGWLNFATRGSVSSLAERRRGDVLRVARENAARYRAGPLRASVVLVHVSEEAQDHQRMPFSRWYGLEVGGIEHRVVAGSHHGMLREPAVGSLAECVEGLIDAVIERQSGAARVD